MLLVEIHAKDGELWLGKDDQSGELFIGIMESGNPYASGTITLTEKDIGALLDSLR